MMSPMTMSGCYFELCEQEMVKCMQGCNEMEGATAIAIVAAVQVILECDDSEYWRDEMIKIWRWGLVVGHRSTCNLLYIHSVYIKG